VHIFRHLFVCFQTTVYTLGEFHQNRNNRRVASETAFATVKSTIDTSNSSNTVLLFLKCKYFTNLICKDYDLANIVHSL